MSEQNLHSSIFYKNPNYFFNGFPKYAARGGKLNIGEKKSRDKSRNFGKKTHRSLWSIC